MDCNRNCASPPVSAIIVLPLPTAMRKAMTAMTHCYLPMKEFRQMCIDFCRGLLHVLCGRVIFGGHNRLCWVNPRDNKENGVARGKAS